MAEADAFSIDAVQNKLKALDIDYVKNNIGGDPAVLPNHVAEYNGWVSILFDHYSSVLRQYRTREASVMKEESAARDKLNEGKEKPRDRVTVTEMQQRIDVRLSDIRSRRDSLEQAVKGATLHLNVCQSLMKNWGDEAKGVR